MSKGTQQVRNQLKLYEEHPEFWKADHDVAMRCRDFESWLAFGVFLFERISRLDEWFHEAAFAGQTAYDPELDQEIVSLYESWAKVSYESIGELAKLEKEGFEVEKAAEFRQCCQEVRGLLTPDPTFFTGDGLVGARDRAIDSHIRGETIATGRLLD